MAKVIPPFTGPSLRWYETVLSDARLTAARQDFERFLDRSCLLLEAALNRREGSRTWEVPLVAVRSLLLRFGPYWAEISTLSPAGLGIHCR